MKILVIDDKPENLRSAEVTLAGHELTLCGTIDAARRELVHGEFDVVLADLFLPVGGNMEAFKAADRLLAVTPAETQVPAGLVFALKAVDRGMPALIFSDTDHHNDLISSLLDLLLHNGGKTGTRARACSSREAPTGGKDWAFALQVARNHELI